MSSIRVVQSLSLRPGDIVWDESNRYICKMVVAIYPCVDRRIYGGDDNIIPDWLNIVFVPFGTNVVLTQTIKKTSFWSIYVS